MKLADMLQKGEVARLAAKTIKIGDVYEITMTEENGIKPKPGDISRNKYFVVLGFDSNGVAYGGVIINSQINKNLPGYIKMYHMPIKQSKYPFLKYDSFVDCVQLKTAQRHKFSEWNYLGSIDEYDVDLIIGTIKESPRESAEHLALFGL
ncbi:MAG: hypothetical protein K2N10_00620 [Muribaculaceae bacterium]|nr:hypothetical protein [Muribaculaceae bacterium]